MHLPASGSHRVTRTPCVQQRRHLCFASKNRPSKNRPVQLTFAQRRRLLFLTLGTGAAAFTAAAGVAAVQRGPLTNGAPMQPGPQSNGAPAQTQRGPPASTAVQGKPGSDKIVYLVRHAQGFHNLGWEQNVDAHLTEVGWKQAAALGRYLNHFDPNLPIDVAIVSVLNRTLETAAGAFGGGSMPEQARGPRLMQVSFAAPNEMSYHAPIAPPPRGFRIIATEGCREHMMRNLCDKRRPLSETRAQFPGVDFGLIPAERDETWARHHAPGVGGEGYEGLQARGRGFAEYLLTRKERHIAVVAHAGFIRAFLEAFPGTQGVMPWGREFDNGELMTFKLRGEKGKPELQPARGPEYPAFAGGYELMNWAPPGQPAGLAASTASKACPPL